MQRHRRPSAWIIATAILGLVLAQAPPSRGLAVDIITRRADGMEQVLAGRVLVAAADKSLLLQTPDGVLWPVLPEELLRRDQDDAPFKPLGQQAQGERMLAQLPAGFEVYRTKHYVICYNSSKAYAQWCGALFERLYAAFHTFWTHRGFKLQEPEFPLVALVFGDQKSYVAYAEGELKETASKIVGYYSLHTNRVALYDLTETAAVRRAGDKRGSSAQINEILSRPEAFGIVATVIHEATHQLAFNGGLHQRRADIPLWVSEGMAVYFETPDLASQQGWRTIGAVHRGRLADFRAALPQRSAGLKSLLVNDARFKDLRQAQSAYAEAWALNHFLMQRKSKAYVAYLQQLAKKSPCVEDTPEERLGEFTTAFGTDFTRLDAEFLKHVGGLK